VQPLQAPFLTTPLTASPGIGGVAGAKIDCELNDGIAGVAVTVPPVERNRATQSPAAATARATNEIIRKTAADMCGD
jgi:hypothetical protein